MREGGCSSTVDISRNLWLEIHSHVSSSASAMPFASFLTKIKIENCMKTTPNILPHKLPNHQPTELGRVLDIHVTILGQLFQIDRADTAQGGQSGEPELQKQHTLKQ